MAKGNVTSLPVTPDANPPGLVLSDEKQKIVDTLVEYKAEAVENRKSGSNPRDQIWDDNLDLYHNRIDFSTKASWQSKNVMPEVPSYVDRFAAELKNTLNATPNSFYTVDDPFDVENNVAQAVKKMTDVWLTSVGRNQVGTPLDFSTVFEEQVKLGALTASAGVVLWRDDVPGGRVSYESVDARFVWLDHTYRNLYRIRRTEIDLADLSRMAGMTSARGNLIYNTEEIARLVSSRRSEDEARKAALSGSGERISSPRKPIMLDEYIATVVDDDGKILMDNEIVLLGDDEFLLRGPEKNPYWHGQDWLIYTPLIHMPLSPYGRSYMEDFGHIAKVFTDMTNLLLDAAYVSSMKAYVLVPDMLKDPTQANDGVWPQKTFLLEEGNRAEDFAKELALGNLDAGSFQIWQALKGELSEGAGMNEISMGRLPQKSHIAATAVAGAQQSTSSMLRSVAQTIETRLLDVALNRIWQTGLQHVRADDKRMIAAVGEDMFRALITRRKELIARPFSFQARGISALIQRQQQLQALLQIMQVIGQNEQLVQAFMQTADMGKLLTRLFELSGVDLSKLTLTEREKMMQAAAQPLQQAAGRTARTPPSDAAAQEMQSVATAMGVNR